MCAKSSGVTRACRSQANASTIAITNVTEIAIYLTTIPTFPTYAIL